jgi:hypothetical protein
MEDLFTGNPTGRPWLPNVSPDARAQLEELADLCVKYGKEPHWKAVHQRFEELFPNDTPRSEMTIANAVRRILKDRKGG